MQKKNCLNCEACMEGTSKTGQTIYECYHAISNGVYYMLENPGEHSCGYYYDKRKAKIERRRRLEREYPELCDSSGRIQEDIDSVAFFAKLAAIEKKRHKSQKIQEIPKKRPAMPEDIYKEYRKIAGLVVELWDVLKEDNALKLRTYASARLDYNNRFEMFLKEALIMLTKKKGFEDRYIWLVTEIEERLTDDWDFSIFHLIERALYYQHEGKPLEEFVSAVATRVSEDKVGDFVEYLYGKVTTQPNTRV